MLFDAGPDFRAQALANQITRLDAVLLTHAHYDHVAGLDDLRPLIPAEQSIPIYAQEATLQGVRERFSYAFAPAQDGTSRPSLNLIQIEHYRPFDIGKVSITPFDVMHGTWLITGFRVGRLGYITDASMLPAASRALLHGLDVLVVNALRFKAHATHFSLEEALHVVEELRPRRTYLVHLTHYFEHATVNAELPPGVSLAYDGLSIEIAGSQGQSVCGLL
jgi:phosphoribosyl 1,2-cyclic phosphate phosphodiesterase